MLSKFEYRTTTSMHANGQVELEVHVNTDNNNYFKTIMDRVMYCDNDNREGYGPLSNQCVPVMGENGHFVCSWCESDIIPKDDTMFYPYCPHCGRRIVYTDHEFLREGKYVYR